MSVTKATEANKITEANPRQRSKNTPEEIGLIARAWAEGKEVQMRATQVDEWMDVINDYNLLLRAYYYRVKPEPRTFEFWAGPTGHIVEQVTKAYEKNYIEAGWTKIKAKEIV